MPLIVDKMSEYKPKPSKRAKIESRTIDSSDSVVNYEECVFKNELILDRILRNLSAKELTSISRVCKLWYRLAIRMARQRSHVEDLFLVYGVSNYMRKDPTRFSKLIALQNVASYSELKDQIIHSLRTQLQTVPSIAIFFNSFKGSIRKSYNSFINSSRLIGLLPKSCSIINVSMSDTGIIGNEETVGPVETMQAHKFISGVSYLFLPDLSDYGCKILPFSGTQSELSEYIERNKIIEHNLKGMITFFKFDGYNTPDTKFVNEIMSIQKHKIALGGIFVEYIDVSLGSDDKSDNPKTISETNFTALMFCGGESINCASLVINGSEIDDLQNLLNNFKRNLHFDHNQPNSEFIGFLFPCAGRGFNIFDKLNLESDLIYELFPNIKLYGIYGLGEIGVDHFGSAIDSSNKIVSVNAFHTFTTILFLIHVNRSKKS